MIIRAVVILPSPTRGEGTTTGIRDRETGETVGDCGAYASLSAGRSGSTGTLVAALQDVQMKPIPGASVRIMPSGTALMEQRSIDHFGSVLRCASLPWGR